MTMLIVKPCLKVCRSFRLCATQCNLHLLPGNAKTANWRKLFRSYPGKNTRYTDSLEEPESLGHGSAVSPATHHYSGINIKSKNRSVIFILFFPGAHSNRNMWRHSGSLCSAHCLLSESNDVTGSGSQPAAVLYCSKNYWHVFRLYTYLLYIHTVVFIWV